MTDTPQPPRRILLGVTGGIAAYKAADLVRRLRERGAEVQVVMTAGAQRFVTPLTFQALSGRAVRTELWDERAEAAMGHIELARWAELVLVAPASADFLARAAAGRADDLLATLCLATSAPLVVAPAMNRQMWAHAATQANVAILVARGVRVLGPGSGEQACGEVGDGRMLEPLEIAEAVLAGGGAAGALPLGDMVSGVASPPGAARPADAASGTAGVPASSTGPLAGLHVVITAGPTREALDPVRFISNRSSGKMGYAVAAAAREAGARVTLVSGPVSLPTPAGVVRVDVESAQQMYDAVHAALGPTGAGADVYIGAAAVADYTPTRCAGQKIKKTSDTLELHLTKARDILASVAQLPQRPFTVGFAAETNDVEKHARDKLVRKRLDLIAANEVGENKAFDREDNALLVLWPDGRRELALQSKCDLAREFVALVAERRGASARSGGATDGGSAAGGGGRTTGASRPFAAGAR
ncbi:MAG: bifunctional phosphopantothenoylcysteine decarboxylase/phosphopantothenate synthase [Steroidobacteraceae bacterium]|nr:bifunctional phosphopantothenoylcysteine decarboxylase/phosphopantothenate synthase [Steroidobacteraceae bacterium]